MKKILVAFLLSATLFPLLSEAQDRSVLDAAVVRFRTFYNNQQTDSIFNMLSGRIQGLMTQDKTKEMMTRLYKQMGDLETISFEKQEDKMANYEAGFKNMNLVLIASLDSVGKLDVFRFVPSKNTKTPRKALPPLKGASDIVLQTVNGGVFGTLTMPDGVLKVPVVLLIAGSGPTDRDGNSSAGVYSNVYRMMADSLQKAGIACVRYDKRGIGQSAEVVKDESAASFDSMVSDAVGYIKMLKADSRFSDVIIAGHSEGSLIGMIAAQKTDIKKYISIAGSGESADKILRTQLSLQSESLASKGAVIMDSLKKGYDVRSIDASLMSLFRPSVQPYMRSWLRYDPQTEIKKVRIPILLIQGEHDLQVPVMHAQLLKKAAPKAQLVMFKDMNHILKDAPADKEQNIATYTNGDLPLTAGLMFSIVNFIKN